jgi:hypothetical protein
VTAASLAARGAVGQQHPAPGAEELGGAHLDPAVAEQVTAVEPGQVGALRRLVTDVRQVLREQAGQQLAAAVEVADDAG